MISYCGTDWPPKRDSSITSPSGDSTSITGECSKQKRMNSCIPFYRKNYYTNVMCCSAGAKRNISSLISVNE